VSLRAAFSPPMRRRREVFVALRAMLPLIYDRPRSVQAAPGLAAAEHPAKGATLNAQRVGSL
jgi:hypothetical protein